MPFERMKQLDEKGVILGLHPYVPGVSLGSSIGSHGDQLKGRSQLGERMK